MICGGRQHLQHDHPGDAAGQHAGGARPPHQQNPAAALQLLPRLPSIRGPRGKVYNNIMRSPPEEPHLAVRLVICFGEACMHFWSMQSSKIENSCFFLV